MIRSKSGSAPISRILLRRLRAMTAIPLGRTLPYASSTLPAGSAGHTSTPAYLGLLQVEIARFTQTKLARLCCSDPHLAVDGDYPLPCPVESGLSSTKKNFAATVWRASVVMVSRGCGVTSGLDWTDAAGMCGEHPPPLP